MKYKINKQIYRNYLFAERIKDLIRHEKNINQKMILIEILAKFNSDNVLGRYSDEYLEEELRKIGDSILFEQNTAIKQGSVLHVMTEAYPTGGHTRLVENWIRCDKDRKYSVILTNQLVKVPDFLKQAVKESGGSLIQLPNVDYLSKAKKLLMVAQSYEKIILNIHMYDIVPIIAFSNINWKTPIYFYNHANYRFWLGVGIADLVLDISRDDQFISKKNRDVFNSKVLDIPIFNEEVSRVYSLDEKLRIRNKMGIKNNVKILTTMASEFKYNKALDLDYFIFVKKVLSLQENLCFCFIGPDSNGKKWIKFEKECRGRVKLLGALNKQEVEQVLAVTEIYVDSFPMCSYTSCLDAIRMGIPVISLRIKGFTLDTLRGIKSTSVEAMILKIKELLENRQQASIIKKYMEEKHYPAGWKLNLDNIFMTEIEHNWHEFKSRLRYSKYEIILNENQKEKTKLKIPNNISIKNRILLFLLSFVHKG